MTFPYAAWVAAIERRHRLIVLGSVCIGLVAALSLVRLRLDMDVLNMLPQGRPAFDDFKSFVADFGELDELVILIEGQPLQQLQAFADAFATHLAALDTVAAVHARIDVQQVMDGMFGRYLYNYLPEPAYAVLEQRLTPAGIEAQVVADRAILSAPLDLSAARAVVEDPLGVRRLAGQGFAESYRGVASRLSGGYFVAPDGTALLVLVRPKASAFDIAFSERLLRQVRAAEAETRRAVPTADVRVAYTGGYVYALEDAATLKWDVGRYTTLALLGVLAVFYFGYRTLRILPFVTYPLVLTTLVTFALSLLLFAELNAVSISFAAILYGLSIDSAIYFYTRLLQEREQHDLRGAVTATLAGLGRANLTASTTTAVAFLVIGLSCLSAVRQLGLLTALGMVLTTLEFFTLYPALGFFLIRRGGGAAGGFETPRLGRLAGGAAQRAQSLAVGAALLAVALFWPARQVALDVHLTHLQPADSEAARIQAEVTRRFGEQETTGAVLVRRGDLEAALVDNETITNRLRAYDGLIRSVQSIDAVLPSARVQRARVQRYNQLPRAAAVDTLRDALRRHGFVAERFTGFFADFEKPRDEVVRIDTPALAPLAWLIAHHIRKRGDQYMVATYVQPADGVSLSAIAERLHRDLGATDCTLTGRSLLEEELRRVLRAELAVFCALGLVGNFLLLLGSFGHVGIAIAILAPVVWVVVALFAMMWALGTAIDPVNLVVTPLIFGLGVDYGVYIVARARERGSVAAAIHYAGRAVVVTALTTVTGFGFLGLSRFPALASMGVLAGVGLLLCLMLSIVLLPALLALVAKGREAQST